MRACKGEVPKAVLISVLFFCRMDKLVSAIQTHSGSEQDLKQLKTLLQKEENVFMKNLSVLDEVLAALDPTAHSLGYTFVL
jgi:hypothetical protein